METTFFLPDAYSHLYGVNESDFTRVRKLPLPDLLNILYSNQGMVLNSQICQWTNQKDIWKVMGSDDINDVIKWRENMKKIGEDKSGEAAALKGRDNCISRTALCNARNKLNPDAIAWQNRITAAALYHKFGSSMEKFHGFIRLGVDGSDHYGPQSAEAREILGTSSNGESRLSNPVMGKLSGLFDLDNHFYLDMQCGSYKYSENELALRHLDVLEEYFPNQKTLIDYDRGYFSYLLMYRSSINPMRSYIFRLSQSHLKQYQDQVSVGEEKVFTFTLDRKSTNEYRNNKALRNKMLSVPYTVRIAKPVIGTNPDGSPKYLVLATDVLPDEISLEELSRAYWSRWQIEESYDHLKNDLMLEKFSGKSVQKMEQEIYAAWTIYNMTSAAVLQSKADHPIEQDHYKHEMKINYGAAFKECIEKLMAIYYTTDRSIRKGLQEELKWAIRNRLVPFRPERASYPRDQHVVSKKGTARGLR